jgi:hypothetical protein
MSEPKPLASLSGALLARKGGARPAMRRQMQLPGTVSHIHGHDDLGWNDMGYDVDPHHTLAESTRPTDHGLSPMGSLNGETQSVRQVMDAAADRASIDPIVPQGPVSHDAEPPLVHRHFQRIAEEIAPAPEPVAVAPAVVALPVAAKAPAKAKAPRARAGTKGAFAFTLRLDPERHLRLRLASATSNRSAQHILIALVDDFLADQPEIAAFAAKLPASAR